MRVETDVQSAATPEQVWRMPVDVAGWPLWSALLTVSGQAQVGQRLHVTAAAPGEQGPYSARRVLAAEPNEVLRRRDPVLLHLTATPDPGSACRRPERGRAGQVRHR